jgi:hypothetical protein
MAALQTLLDKFHEQCMKASKDGDTEASLWLTEQLRKAQELTLDVGSGKVILSFNDPGEDVDDVMAIYLFFALLIGHRIVCVLAGGGYAPSQRFAFLKRMLPFLRNAEWGVPVHNDITFYADGADLPDLEYDIVLNCAPTSEANFRYITDKIKNGGRAVLVGAAADGGFTNAINQRYTDGVATKEKWDAFRDALRAKNVEQVVLQTSVSRNVTFLNPAKVPPENPSSSAMLRKISPDFEDLFFKNAARFVLSRPYKNLPANVMERIHCANAHLCMRAFKHLVDKVTEKNLTTYEKFASACAENGLSPSVYEPAMVCFGVSDLLDAKYTSEFSIDPTDHAGRESLSCVHNGEEVTMNLANEATELIPAYDASTICLAFAARRDLERFGFIA